MIVIAPLYNRQKWKIALIVFVVYWPLRLYVAVNDVSVSLLQKFWFNWLVESLVTVLFFWLWLSLTEVSQQVFNKVRKGHSSDKVKGFTQLVIMCLAVSLSVLLNDCIWALWRGGLRIESAASNGFETLHSIDNRQVVSTQRKFEYSLTTLAILSVYILSTSLKRNRFGQVINEHIEQLQQEAEQLKFSVAKNQTDPHFLFENLTHLSSLIKANSKQAIQFIAQLTRTYRYINYQSTVKTVTLQEELDFLEGYTSLLEARCVDPFRVVNEVLLPDSQRHQIIPLTLQVVVDNALKHNQWSDEVPLLVTIEIEPFYLVISNLIWSSTERKPSSGSGLKNLVRSYQLLTNRPVLIEKRTSVFIIKIPLLA